MLAKGKIVVCIGGVSGVGKTTLSKLLVDGGGCIVEKQRAALIDAGSRCGILEWQDVAARHDELVIPAAELVARRFIASEASVLLLDCHYSIRARRALRLRGCIREPYIHDLDRKFVGVLAELFEPSLVILEVDAIVAAQRCRQRNFGALEFDHTVEEIQRQLATERHFAIRLARELRVPRERLLTVVNLQSPERAVAIVRQYIAERVE